MTDIYGKIDGYARQISSIFQGEGAAVPAGFTSKDANVKAPKLYDHGFDIMFLRLIKQISMGMHTLSLTMSYREDMMQLFRGLTHITRSATRTVLATCWIKA